MRSCGGIYNRIVLSMSGVVSVVDVVRVMCGDFDLHELPMVILIVVLFGNIFDEFFNF